jgi:hypothetical protein
MTLYLLFQNPNFFSLGTVGLAYASFNLNRYVFIFSSKIFFSIFSLDFKLIQKLLPSSGVEVNSI